MIGAAVVAAVIVFAIVSVFCHISIIVYRCDTLGPRSNRFPKFLDIVCISASVVNGIVITVDSTNEVETSNLPHLNGYSSESIGGCFGIKYSFHSFTLS